MYKVSSEESGLSLTHFLKQKLGVSHRAIKLLLDRGRVLLNGHKERFGTTLVGKGDLVEVALEAKIEVLYEDDSVVVYNKPAGITTEAFAGQVKGILMHRLDKETSGVLLFAKNASEAKHIERLFRERVVEKCYVAIVHGCISNKYFTVHNRLGVKEARPGQKVMGSVKEGLEAITDFECITPSRLLCRPKTGRTHQIRVHLSELGYPIVGDDRYGGRGDRLMLHALSLRFTTSQGKEVFVEAPCTF